MENSDLRERLEIVENLQNGGVSSDIQNRDAIKKSRYNENNKQQQNVTNNNNNNIAHEILQLRKDKRKLNERIKQLEIDNLNLQQKVNPNFTHAEPTRTHLQQVLPSSSLCPSTALQQQQQQQQSLQQVSRHRSVLKSHTPIDDEQSNSKNNGSFNQGRVITTPFNNSHINNQNPLEDTNNSQSAIARDSNINNNIKNSTNQIGCNIDPSTEQKTRFVRKEQSSKQQSQQSKQYLRDESTNLLHSAVSGSGGNNLNNPNNSCNNNTNNNKIQQYNQLLSQTNQQQPSQLSQLYYQQMQSQQTPSSFSQANSYLIHPPLSMTTTSQQISNTQNNNNNHNNNTYFNNTPNNNNTPFNNTNANNNQLTSSNALSQFSENEQCPSISQNVYSIKKQQFCGENQLQNLNNSHIYSYNQVQTTTSVSSSSQNVPRTVFVTKEAKLQDDNSYKVTLQKSQANSHTSSSSGYYQNSSNSNNNNNNNSYNQSNISKNGRMVSYGNDGSYRDSEISPNRVLKTSHETQCNWRAKITPTAKNMMNRSITNSRRPPRSFEETRQCKTPLHTRPELPSLNNISSMHPNHQTSFQQY